LTGNCDITFKFGSDIFSPFMTDMQVLPDRRIAVLNGETINICNMQTGKCDVGFANDSPHKLETIAIFPDERIVTSSSVGTIIIWS
jgi:hypothetical protein